MLEFLFNKVAGLHPGNFIKNRLQHSRFPVKFKKFLKTPFFTEHLRLALLANGAPYLVKLRVTFFIQKIELHSLGIFVAI